MAKQTTDTVPPVKDHPYTEEVHKQTLYSDWFILVMFILLAAFICFICVYDAIKINHTCVPQ